MMRNHLLLGAIALVLLAPQTIAHQTVTGTSSTGDVDTWGITLDVPCDLDEPPTIHIDPISWPPEPIDARQIIGDTVQTPPASELVPDCLAMNCPMDLYTFTIRLELLAPSEIDAVGITQVGDGYAPGDLSGLFNTQVPADDPVALAQAVAGTSPDHGYPSDVATYDDPVAEIPVQLGGCNRSTTVAVTGIIVNGETPYALTY